MISPEEGYLTEELQERLQSCRAAAPAGASRASCGEHVQLRRGELLHDVDKTIRHFYFLIEVLPRSTCSAHSRPLPEASLPNVLQLHHSIGLGRKSIPERRSTGFQ